MVDTWWIVALLCSESDCTDMNSAVSMGVDKYPSGL